MAMITPEYVLTMARYNTWQNRQMKTAFEGMSEEALREDRGAFFGSILGTLNHLLWGDMIWMARFDGGGKPSVGIPESVDLTASLSEWAVARGGTDGRILAWAETVDAVDLAGDLAWFSGAAGRDVTRPMGLCVIHMFNHQTHHRGQIHAMAMAAGATGWVSDLFLMPEEGAQP